MLLAIVVTELILQKSHSTIMMNIQMPIYLHASKQDESAGRVYANPKIQKNPDGSIPIHSDVQSLQQLS